MAFASKEKAAAYQAAYYRANKKRVEESISDWRKRHPEKVKSYLRKWRDSNAERERETRTKYRRNNKEKINIANRNTHAKRRSGGGKLSAGLFQKLMAKQKGKCVVCRRSLKKHGCHMDHIIPLARGGKNIDGNIQLTCPKCNCKKGSKDPIRFKQEQGFLL